MFWARSSNAAHRMNTASPSTVCPLRSRRRVLCAMVKVTVSPLCSGFAVILPTSVSVGSPAMGSWSPYFSYVSIFSITSIYEEKTCRISISTEEKNLTPIRHTPFSRMVSLHYDGMNPSRLQADTLPRTSQSESDTSSCENTGPKKHRSIDTRGGETLLDLVFCGASPILQGRACAAKN